MNNKDGALPSGRAFAAAPSSPAASTVSASIPSADDLLARIAKAEQEIDKCEASLEKAIIKHADLLTAFRVVFGGDAASESAPESTSKVGLRHKAIIELLGIGSLNAKPPAILFKEYCKLGLDTVNKETFRTTIWRMVNLYRFPGWIIQSDGNGYWKRPAQAIEARSGETGTGSIRQDESAVPAGDAPNTDAEQPGDEK